MNDPQNILPSQSSPTFARKLGLFDATMIVMGGIIGAGIFMNPSVVANQVHTPVLILSAWVLGGIVALIGAFVYAELAWRMPKVGGQYAYISAAYHPLPAFLYGWAELLVIGSGGMAAVAMTFARYLLEITHLPFSETIVAIAALIFLTAINCLGVRTGGTVQNVLMVLKVLAIAVLIIAGLFLVKVSNFTFHPLLDRPFSGDFLTAFGAAMVPVLFAYGGWQTSNFVAAEIREPRKNLPRGLLLGVIGVVALYVLVNFVCINVLGAEELAHTTAPASAVMKLLLGENGAALIGIGIAISTLGFLSQSILTAPRLYYAMANDGLFFKSVAKLHPRTQVPVLAIVIQGIFASIVALSGSYSQILNYVVSVDFIFFGLSATCIFAFRRKQIISSESHDDNDAKLISVPGHPYSTLFFIAVSWIIVANAVYTYPTNTVIGIGIMLTGIPMYYFWKWKNNAMNNEQ